MNTLKTKLIKLSLGVLVTLALFTGCQTLFDSVVTIKEVGDSISAEYASLYKQGLISPEADAKAEAAHAKYREAMGALAAVLETAKLTGDQSTLPAALRVVKEALRPLIAIITPLVSNERAARLTTDLNRAVAAK